jgi:DNA glycosylase AlkZ-like
MGERVLTLQELNRATLARQLLLERRRLPVVRALERLAGLQAQWPPSPYVGLWSRLAGFRRGSLERAILRGEVVKATLMRSTLHLVSRRDYSPYWTALHDLPWGDAAARADAERIAPELRELAARGPVTLAEAVAYLGERHGLADLHARRVWHLARVRAHVHHAPHTALWTTRPEATYARLDGHEEIDRVAAVAHVVRAYLAAFGPATRADVAEWSGLRIRDFAEALEALEPLRRFRKEDGKELLDLARAPLPPADARVPVRFLPKWDNLLLAHADRRRVLGDEHRKKIIVKNGDVTQTFLVDGVVAGTWTLERGRVAMQPFDPLPRTTRRAVEDEAARLEAWLR